MALIILCLMILMIYAYNSCLKVNDEESQAIRHELTSGERYALNSVATSDSRANEGQNQRDKKKKEINGNSKLRSVNFRANNELQAAKMNGFINEVGADNHKNTNTNDDEEDVVCQPEIGRGRMMSEFEKDLQDQVEEQDAIMNEITDCITTTKQRDADVDVFEVL